MVKRGGFTRLFVSCVGNKRREPENSMRHYVLALEAVPIFTTPALWCRKSLSPSKLKGHRSLGSCRFLGFGDGQQPCRSIDWNDGEQFSEVEGGGSFRIGP